MSRWHTVGDIAGAIAGTTLGIVDATPGTLGTVGITLGTLGTVGITLDMPGTLGTVGIMPGTLVTDKSSELAAVCNEIRSGPQLPDFDALTR
jgi:hypothetical protein